jgi:ABC-2 type transport system permease protein
VRSLLLPVAELRGRLLWRRLTARGGIGEGVARVVLLVLALPLGLAFAVAVGAGTHQAVRAGGGLRLDVATAAIFFGLWQTWTAVSLTLNDREGLDLRRFLVYPVRPGRIYALGLASGVAGDPVGVFWAVVLSGVFGGAAFARPGPWLLLLALGLLLFAAGTVLYVALLQELLSLALSSRRMREAAMVLSVLVSVGLLTLLVGVSPRSWRDLRLLAPALSVAQWIAWPAALTAGAARHLYAGRALSSLPWLAGLALACAATGRVAFAVALRQAQAGGDAAARAPSSGGRGWRLPLPGPLEALVEKEAKYLVRHPLARIAAVLTPVIAALIAWKVEPAIPQEAGEVVRALPLFALAAYSHLVLQSFWLNALGWERGGARLLFLAPLGARAVLFAKNAVLYLYALAVFSLSAVPLLAAGGPPPAWAIAGALALHAGMAPFLHGAGNLVTILNPKAASFAVQRSASVSALSGLAGLAILSATTGLFALPVLAALRLDSPWLLPAGWAALGLAGALAYRAALPAQARLLADRAEVVVGVVSGDPA